MRCPSVGKDGQPCQGDIRYGHAIGEHYTSLIGVSEPHSQVIWRDHIQKIRLMCSVQGNVTFDKADLIRQNLWQEAIEMCWNVPLALDAGRIIDRLRECRKVILVRADGRRVTKPEELTPFGVSEREALIIVANDDEATAIKEALRLLRVGRWKPEHLDQLQARLEGARASGQLSA